MLGTSQYPLLLHLMIIPVDIHMSQSGLQSQSAFFNRGDIDGDGAGARCT